MLIAIMIELFLLLLEVGKIVFGGLQDLLGYLRGRRRHGVRLFFPRRHEICCKYSYQIPSSWNIICLELELYDFEGNTVARVTEEVPVDDRTGHWVITHDMLTRSKWSGIESLLTPKGARRPEYSGDVRDDLPWRFSLRCGAPPFVLTAKDFFSPGMSNKRRLQVRLDRLGRALDRLTMRIKKKGY